MTAHRAWALLALAALGLGLTPWAGLASALASCAALGALAGLAALQARDTAKADRLDRMEAALRALSLTTADTEKRTAEMWRVYQAGA